MSEPRKVGEAWVIDVTDLAGNDRTFAFAVRNGQVVFSGPKWCSADLDAAQALASRLNEELAKARGS